MLVIAVITAKESIISGEHGDLEMTIFQFVWFPAFAPATIAMQDPVQTDHQSVGVLPDYFCTFSPSSQMESLCIRTTCWLPGETYEAISYSRLSASLALPWG
jgi:hypothetical protein